MKKTKIEWWWPKSHAIPPLATGPEKVHAISRLRLKCVCVCMCVCYKEEGGDRGVLWPKKFCFNLFYMHQAIRKHFLRKRRFCCQTHKHARTCTHTHKFGKHWCRRKKTSIGASGLGSYPSSIMLAVQFSSFAQSCPTLCDPMNCSTPGLPVHHQLPEFTQTHVHWAGDAIQPAHPLSSPSPPALNLSQYQGLFKWVSSLHQMAKVLEFQLQHQSFQWTPRTDLL